MIWHQPHCYARQTLKNKPLKQKVACKGSKWIISTYVFHRQFLIVSTSNNPNNSKFFKIISQKERLLHWSSLIFSNPNKSSSSQTWCLKIHLNLKHMNVYFKQMNYFRIATSHSMLIWIRRESELLWSDLALGEVSCWKSNVVHEHYKCRIQVNFQQKICDTDTLWGPLS